MHTLRNPGIAASFVSKERPRGYDPGCSQADRDYGHDKKTLCMGKLACSDWRRRVSSYEKPIALNWAIRCQSSSCHAIVAGFSGPEPSVSVSRSSSSKKRAAGPICSIAEHGTGVEQEDRSQEVYDEDEEVLQEEPRDLSGIVEWQIDFCSRPILDSRGKKLWELLVCDSERRLEHAEYFANNKVNSVTLREALVKLMERTGAQKPQKIRFFRSQVQTIISKACAELDIQPVPSQRCLTLVRWLEERSQTVYKNEPGYQANPISPLLEQPTVPQDLPGTLRGEQWAFVQLPLSGVREEMAAVEDGKMFGSVFSLESLGIPLSDDLMIPGVAVASSRATPLSAWTNALELASIQVDVPKACLVLNSGVNDRWRYAFFRRSRQADREAMAWEAAKQAVGGLHFLAVQRQLDAEQCTGFWLLQDLKPPKI